MLRQSLVGLHQRRAFPADLNFERNAMRDLSTKIALVNGSFRPAVRTVVIPMAQSESLRIQTAKNFIEAANKALAKVFALQQSNGGIP